MSWDVVSRIYMPWDLGFDGNGGPCTDALKVALSYIKFLQADPFPSRYSNILYHPNHPHIIRDQVDPWKL